MLPREHPKRNDSSPEQCVKIASSTTILTVSALSTDGWEWCPQVYAHISRKPAEPEPESNCFYQGLSSLSKIIVKSTQHEVYNLHHFTVHRD
jgi:hypothetical protein